MRKENQGIRDAGQFGRVPEWVVRDTGEFGWVPERVIRDAGQFGQVPGFFVVHFSFFVVPGRGVLHTPHKTTRQGRVQDDGKG
ncbi:hypothetical protein T235_15450 [Tannerella sp. oral taxon BU063 isolate Cell 8/11]|uniref:Uncharacterized protein n=1 Tax=Tannerella sp. oral taxon BU063 isolate Cell 8/11 TaxID=1411915 RepID=W2CW81_9BACT|nr:hypothetical protein T235_15450 [Tannerella sp. oral taxon BU063 isolate Cell 8/11]